MVMAFRWCFPYGSSKGALKKMKWKTRGGLMGTASGGQSLRHRYDAGGSEQYHRESWGSPCLRASRRGSMGELGGVDRNKTYPRVLYVTMPQIVS